MLNITKTQNEGNLTVKLAGRLDTTTAPDLESQLKDGIESVKDLVLDFKDLDYISSAGLRVLLSLQKIMNAQGSMKLINVGEVIPEIFDVTGFSDILTIEG